MQKLTISFIFALLSFAGISQPINPTLPDPNQPTEISGMKLVWADEFNTKCKYKRVQFA